ncbi:uncharacterized protein LOC101452095 [Ceratitis capitata]|uniref:uncharacterized protein LOC101452095 n=1 Tax=Ceratitis capitata TaxID=7213 RepID=UPI00032A1BEE|nr:uncharacterized protein LOC101452095 [Ceratitis capitata]
MKIKVFLIISLQIVIFQTVCALKTCDVIDKLNIDLRLELNIFLNITEDSADELCKHSGLTPKIILDYEHADLLELNGWATENVLTVAFVGVKNKTKPISTLVKLLWQLHYTNVLFVYKSSMSGVQLYELFALCWQHGFVNVLILIQQTLYTYHPFPAIKVLELRTLSAYYDKSHLEDFQGHPLRSSISNNAPRVYHYTDDDGNLANGGYLYALLLTFIRQHNGTFQEVKMPTYDLNLTQTIAAFNNRDIDILAELLFMYPEYAHSAVVCIYRTLLMAPYAKPLQSYLYILQPLTRFIWLLIIIAFCYSLIAQMLLSRLRTRRFNFGAALLRIVSGILYLPTFYYRNCARTQIICAIMLLASGFLLTNFYQTSLASMFITRLYEPQINTIADIAHTNFRLPITKTDAAYLNSLAGVPEIINDRLIEMNPLETYTLLRDLNTSYVLSSMEDKIMFFMYQQKFLRIPRVKVIDEELAEVPLFIALAHGSPFIQQLNRFLGQIFDTGIFQKMVSDSAEEGILTNEIRFFRTVSAKFYPLSVQNFSMIFVAWAFGLMCATVCFLIEWKFLKK